jgi:hypothetical protein
METASTDTGHQDPGHKWGMGHPEKAAYSDRGRTYKTRPVCPYPQVAIYKGSGDTNDAANFKCGEPTW